MRNFPLYIAIAGTVLTLMAVRVDWRALRAEFAHAGTLPALVHAAGEKALFGKSMQFFALLAALIPVVMVIGIKLAIPLYVLVYLLTWGKVRPGPALLYTLGCWAVLIGFYDRALHQAWYPSLLYDWLGGTFPDWFPEWLII